MGKQNTTKNKPGAGGQKRRKRKAFVFDSLIHQEEAGKPAKTSNRTVNRDTKAVTTTGNESVDRHTPGSSAPSSARRVFDLTTVQSSAGASRPSNQLTEPLTSTKNSVQMNDLNEREVSVFPPLQPVVSSSAFPSASSDAIALDYVPPLPTQEVARSDPPLVSNSELSDATRQWFRQELRNQMKGMFSGMSNSITAVRGDIEELKKEVSEIKCAMSQLHTVVDTIDLKPAKARKQSDPSKQIEGFSVLFNRVVNNTVLERCVLGMTSKIVLSNDNSSDFLTKVGLSLQSLMFALQPEDSKKEFESTVGLNYCALRRSMVRAALGIVKEDLFSRFVNERMEDGQEVNEIVFWNGRKLRGFGKKIQKPIWCTDQFITPAHINLVQQRIEKLHKYEDKTKVNIFGDEGNNELALNVCACLFTRMTSELTRARDRCKRTFFEQLGFLFCNWKDCGISLRQEMSEFIWLTDSSSAMGIESIPDASTYRIGRGDDERVRQANFSIWNDIIKKNPEFTLLVCYEVCVRQPKAKGAREAREIGSDDEETESSADQNESPDPPVAHSLDGDVCFMYRAFNLLDVAAHFYTTYCGNRIIDNDIYIIGASAHSFRSFFAMASMMRHWLSKVIEDYKLNGPPTFTKHYNQRKNRTDLTMFMYELFPSISRMTTTLFQNCLSLSTEEFDDDCLDEKYCSRFKSYKPSTEGMEQNGEDDKEDYEQGELDFAPDSSWAEGTDDVEDGEDDFTHG